MAACVLGQLRLDLAADIGRARAAARRSGSRPAGRSGSAPRRSTFVRTRARFSSGSGIGIAASSAEVYGWIGLCVELLGGRELHHLAEVHDRDPVGDVAHDAEVVGDEHVAQPELVLQLVEQVDHLRLDRDVERRDRLVEQDQLRVDRERARDPDALALAAGELVRDSGSRCSGRRPTRSSSLRLSVSIWPAGDAAQLQRRRQDLADALARVERRLRVLEDHLHLTPDRLHRSARGLGDVGAAEA